MLEWPKKGKALATCNEEGRDVSVLKSAEQVETYNRKLGSCNNITGGFMKYTWGILYNYRLYKFVMVCHKKHIKLLKVSISSLVLWLRKWK